MLSKYRHIIWDWNGTLFNDVSLCVSIVNHLLVKRKMPAITIDYYRSIFTFPVVEYYRKVGFDFSKETFEMIGKEWMNEYESRKYECNLFDGTREVLDGIRRQGIGQSILSAYSQNTLSELLDHHTITDYFNHIVGLDHIYADSKLHLGHQLMKKLNISKRHVVLIGDTLHDLEVADKIGADCILISNGHQSKGQLSDRSNFILNRIGELLL